jgi:tRNA(Ile2) C34 agmatinyltransferase TiaS
MGAPGPRIPDFLMGLAPAASSTCPRCGSRTAGLSNGRGRLDFCAQCGTLEVASPEGLPVMRMQDLTLHTVPKRIPKLSGLELHSEKRKA